MSTPTFHPDFLDKSFQVNTSSILTALAPVAASMAGGDNEVFARLCHDYLKAYGDYLSSLTEREFTYALSVAGRALAATVDA
jgi:hypothetical protein